MRLLLAIVLLAAQSGTKEDLLPGLVATYRDRGHGVKVIAPAPRFYLAPEESVHPAIAAAFDAEWTGLISVVQAGNYRVESGPAEVWIDGRSAGPGKPVQLTAGRHPITVKYHRKPGVAALRLEWQTQQFPLEPIPSSVLSHRASESVGREDARI